MSVNLIYDSIHNFSKNFSIHNLSVILKTCHLILCIKAARLLGLKTLVHKHRKQKNVKTDDLKNAGKLHNTYYDV